jgi:hypothetical protein
MFRRPVVLASIAVAGAAGYYLYTAGGDPKAAEKKFSSECALSIAEREILDADVKADDAAAASSALKSRLPGSEKEGKTQSKLSAEQAGQKVDAVVSFCPSSMQ